MYIYIYIYIYIEYTHPKSKSKKHKNRNIIWFNTLYNKCVASNTSREFRNLIRKNFPNRSPLPKIFNRNNKRVSYSCTSNTYQIIKGHNKNIETATALT